MAVPTFVAASSVVSGTGSITLDVPTGTQDDDLMLMVLEQTDDAGISTPSGWTAAPENLSTAPGAGTSLIGLFYRVADSEPASYSGIGGGTDHIIGAIISYRGVSTSNPFNTSASDNDTTATLSLPSVTTTVDDCLVVYAVAANAAISFSGWNDTAGPSPATERVDGSTTDGGDGSIGVADADFATAGSTGAGEVDLSASTEVVGATLALAPAGTQVEPTGVASTFAAGTAQLNRTAPITGLASGLAFGTAQINRTLPVTGVASTLAFGDAAVGTPVRPSGVASTLAFGTAQLNRTLPVTGVASTLAFGTASVGLNIGLTGISSTLSFGTAALQIDQNISMTGLASSLAFGTLAIGTLKGGGFYQNATEPAGDSGDGVSFFNTHTSNSGDKAGFYGS